MGRRRLPSQDDVKKILEENKVLWLYEGPPSCKKPHAKLTSGQCSNGFCNIGQPLKENSDIRENLSHSLIALFYETCGDKMPEHFDRVVGADTSSTVLVKEIAEYTNADPIIMHKTEDKRQIWDPINKPLKDGDVILQVEDLITTAFSALRVRAGIRLYNPDVNFKFIPYLPTIVDRTDPDKAITAVENSKIISLLRLKIKNYELKDCPYCAVGSVPLEPKKGNNWQLLTGTT